MSRPRMGRPRRGKQGYTKRSQTHPASLKSPPFELTRNNSRRGGCCADLALDFATHLMWPYNQDRPIMALGVFPPKAALGHSWTVSSPKCNTAANE